jgi:hypothetical protein
MGMWRGGGEHWWRPGANVDQALTTNGATPLFASAKNGNVEVLRALMEAGANVDQALTTNGTTPLVVSADNGNVEVVRALVEAGANVNQILTIDDHALNTICSEWTSQGGEGLLTGLVDRRTHRGLACSRSGRTCGSGADVGGGRRKH